ncbi:MAG: putative saccharopine dehydrogenase/reductase [Frankiales bacterium]|nr:putative saccharopine dehydrogenase/reductase [Frankiales bacterium]
MTSPTAPSRPARELDIVVFGATGFVGRLLAAHLARSAPSGTRIGLGGRSLERLEEVRAGLGAAAAGWPLLVADTGDPAALADLAARTRVVATTVGPYAKYGLPLVEACARAGTDYADLTGEVLFVRDSAERFHDLAGSTGARLVHACGFDSIPSDLGVLLLAERARADGEGELEDTTLLLVSVRGGVSGGTIDSARHQVDLMRRDRAVRALVADPYSLSPDRAGEPDLGDEADAVLGVQREDGVWTGPFVMAPFNTRIVRRSNALTGWSYGRRFRYREAMGFGRSVAAPVLAAATAVGTLGVMAGMALTPTRLLLDRVLPRPGEGPDEQTRQNGHFRVEVTTRTSTGARYRSVVAAKGDPGYAATAVMQGESALCLALDRDRLPDRAGVLTPATAMGSALADRLSAAGFTIAVERL